VREFRAGDADTPVVLMGYANPIEAMGAGRFVAAARAAGVDGVLVVDYPPEECVSFAATSKAAGIDPIFLLAPTSTDALRPGGAVGSGYIYYVSLKGVTGAGHLDLDEVRGASRRSAPKVGMPVGVGFGIRDAESARRIAAVADAVVIGSRIIEEIEQSPRDAGRRAMSGASCAASARTALDANRGGQRGAHWGP
jgi:tryptophan synthase alpha chain